MKDSILRLLLKSSHGMDNMTEPLSTNTKPQTKQHKTMNIENLTASEVHTIASIFNDMATNAKTAFAMPNDSTANT